MRVRIISFYAILALLIYALIEVPSWLVWKYYVSKLDLASVYVVMQQGGDINIAHKQQYLSNPYSLYWNNPEFENEYGKQFDSHGYRSPEYSPTPGTFKIMAMGGSTTSAHPYVANRDLIWTSLLHQKLSDQGIQNHVFNAGLSNGTSAELMVHYLMTGQEMKPDLLILHVGGNDIVPLFWDTYKTDYSHVRRSLNGVFVIHSL
jgi:hypothetical protein